MKAVKLTLFLVLVCGFIINSQSAPSISDDIIKLITDDSSSDESDSSDSEGSDELISTTPNSTEETTITTETSTETSIDLSELLNILRILTLLGFTSDALSIPEPLANLLSWLSEGDFSGIDDMLGNNISSNAATNPILSLLNVLFGLLQTLGNLLGSLLSNMS